MRTILACTLTTLVTAGVFTSLGLSRSNPRSGPICGPKVERGLLAPVTHYVCTLRTMPSLNGQGFELRVLPIDLRCDAYPANPQFNIPPMLACNRLSLATSKCVDGVFGSWTAEISSRRIEVDSPQSCVLQPKPPGYKLTGRYVPHVFNRNP